MSFAFEKLIVYQKAVDFADKITALIENLSRGYYFLSDQFNRAALSIATNIAVGNPAIFHDAEILVPFDGRLVCHSE